MREVRKSIGKAGTATSQYSNLSACKKGESDGSLASHRVSKALLTATGSAGIILWLDLRLPFSAVVVTLAFCVQ